LGMASMALVSLQQFLEDAVELFSSTQSKKDEFVTKYRPILEEF